MIVVRSINFRRVRPWVSRGLVLLLLGLALWLTFVRQPFGPVR
jgi:hypothetical protein